MYPSQHVSSSELGRRWIKLPSLNPVAPQDNGRSKCWLTQGGYFVRCLENSNRRAVRHRPGVLDIDVDGATLVLFLSS